jgi:hypothetical protein
MSSLTVGSIEGLVENSNVISVPTGHTLNAVDGLQINGVSAGAYTDYSGSMTFTNFTLGDGTINYAHYTQIGDFVHFAGQVTLGSTSSITGNLGGSLPVTSDIRERGAGNCEFIDSGVGAYGGAAHANGVSLGIYCLEETGGYVRNQTVISTRPFTWTTGDSFSWTVVYKAA